MRSRPVKPCRARHAGSSADASCGDPSGFADEIGSYRGSDLAQCLPDCVQLRASAGLVYVEGRTDWRAPAAPAETRLRRLATPAPALRSGRAGFALRFWPAHLNSQTKAAGRAPVSRLLPELAGRTCRPGFARCLHHSGASRPLQKARSPRSQSLQLCACAQRQIRYPAAAQSHPTSNTVSQARQAYLKA